jgi:hypothetical protein
MTIITSQGVPFGGSNVAITSTEAVIVAAQDNAVGIPVIHTLQLKPISGQTLEIEFYDGSTATTILKTKASMNLENLELFGEPGDSIRVKASSGSTTAATVTGSAHRTLPGYGSRMWKYATIANASTPAYATLYDTPAGETIVIQRGLISASDLDEVSIGYADDTAGVNYVPVIIARVETLDQGVNFECPKGKKILLYATDGAATATYALFQGMKK